MRKVYKTNAKWEDIVAYSRAVRVHNVIEVSGTTAVKDGEVVGVDDPYVQAKTCFEIALKAIKELGGDISDITRTRMYVTNIDQWEDIGRAHQEFFQDFPPATTMVEVSRLIDDRLIVEIEVSAVCG